MLGTTNAKYSGEYEFNENPQIQSLNFKAGMSIAKGDLVEVISEELPDELPVTIQDKNAAYFTTMAKPRLLDNNINMFQAFHLNYGTIASLGADGKGVAQQIHSSTWGSTLSELSKESVLTTPRTVSTYPSLNWGEPLYIGNGYWLIPGENGTTTFTVDDIVYDFPPQVLLVHVDQGSGEAKPIDNIFIQGNGKVTCWNNISQFGRPLIFQVSDTQFVFAYKSLLDSSYEISVRGFEIVFDEENVAKTKMKWTSTQSEKIYSKVSAFIFYGMCGNFVNKETKDIYFLVEEPNQIAHLQWNNKNNTLIKYQSIAIDIDLTPIRDINYTVQNDTGVPLVVPYHNNLSSYNVIKSDDNKHCLAVYNNYYWDFEVDYEKELVYARVFPLRYKPSFTIRATHEGKEAATSTSLQKNYNIRDWDLVTSNLKAFRNQNGNAVNAQIPWLWKVSDTKYLMAFLTTGTITTGLTSNGTAVSAQTTTIALTYGAPCYAMLDYCEDLYTLRKDERFAFTGAVGTGVTLPEPAVSKNIIFLDPNNYIHHICPGYTASSYLYTVSRSYSPLTFAQKNALVYKYGTKPVSKKENLRLLYTGIANNAAIVEENVEILGMPENVSLLYKSLEEQEQEGGK